MAQGDLRQALQYAAKNPDSDFAKQLTQYIQSGQADEQAQQLGINLEPIKARAGGSNEVTPEPVTTEPERRIGGLTGDERRATTVDVLKGFGKGAISTLQNIGKPVTDRLGRAMGILKEGEETGVSQETLQPTNADQELGKNVERIAEFLIPSSKIAQGTKAVTGLVKGAGAGSRLLRIGMRSGIEATTAAGITAAQEGDIQDENVKTAAIIASLFPVVGSVVKSVGKATKATGEKIQISVVKPSQADIKDGFKTENLTKYNIKGGLGESLYHTNAELNRLSQELQDKLANSSVPVNLRSVYEKTIKELSGNKASNFGNNKSLERVIGNLEEEIIDVVGPNGLAELPEANLIKRAAGTKGSWVFGSADPDANAVETVYTAFYRNMRQAIEEAADKSGQGGINEINKQISELIPINNAILRRIPIEQRNNAISLGEMLSLTGSIFDPRALAVYGASKLSKSKGFGDALVRAGEMISNPETRNSILKRFFGN